MALGTILPSFIIMLAIALFFQQFKHIPAVENIFKGIRPAVVALIAAPTFKMAKSAKISRYNIFCPADLAARFLSYLRYHTKWTRRISVRTIQE